MFWGTEEKISSESTEEDLIVQEKTRLQKSLKPLEEIKIFHDVMLDPTQEGEYFGIALMFGLGLRNAEACGARFRDIVPIKGPEEFYALMVINTASKAKIKRDKTNEGTFFASKATKHSIKLGGKTKNAFRFIPIPDMLKTLFDKRLEFICSSAAYSDYCAEDENFNAKELPIACIGHDFKKRCGQTDLSRLGKSLLCKAKVNENILNLIDNAIKYDDEIKEKEPTAYLFRRNFATMLQILGLNQNEIEYIMGHNIESNIDPIKQKIDNRPLFSSQYASGITKEVSPGTVASFDNPYRQNICIPKGFGPGTIILNVHASAPGASIEFAVKSTDNNSRIEYNAYSSIAPRDKSDRATSILKTVHHEYAKNRGQKSKKEETDDPE